MDPLLAAYLSLTFALVITPGATTAVVVRNTLAGGKRAGLLAAVGAACGNTTHAAAAGLGVALLVARLPSVVLGVQIAGGVFLAWLGSQSLWRAATASLDPAGTSPTHRNPTTAPASRAWREGLTVNLLNPAIATFYLAVVPTFVPRPAPRGYYLLLASVHIGMAFVCHAAWTFALDALRHTMSRPRARRTMDGITGAALLILAAQVLITTWTSS